MKRKYLFPFSLVNQMLYLKQAPLCRTVAELLPLKEVKERSGEVFLVILPFFPKFLIYPRRSARLR